MLSDKNKIYNRSDVSPFHTFPNIETNENLHIAVKGGFFLNSIKIHIGETVQGILTTRDRDF